MFYGIKLPRLIDSQKLSKPMFAGFVSSEYNPESGPMGNPEETSKSLGLPPGDLIWATPFTYL